MGGVSLTGGNLNTNFLIGVLAGDAKSRVFVDLRLVFKKLKGLSTKPELLRYKLQARDISQPTNRILAQSNDPISLE